MRRAYLTDSTGSAGTAVITHNKALLWTDLRQGCVRWCWCAWQRWWTWCRSLPLSRQVCKTQMPALTLLNLVCKTRFKMTDAISSKEFLWQIRSYIFPLTATGASARHGHCSTASQAVMGKQQWSSGDALPDACVCTSKGTSLILALLSFDLMDAALWRSLLFAITSGSWINDNEDDLAWTDSVDNMEGVLFAPGVAASPNSGDVPVTMFSRRLLQRTTYQIDNIRDNILKTSISNV
jgi:hypothetical protein